MTNSNFDSLVISLGSNVGNRIQNLATAEKKLTNYFNLISKSRIYESEPVDYLEQNNFLNMALEFKLKNNISPLDILQICQKIEVEMERIKIIDKGPRNIDVDIIFLGSITFESKELTIPHPAWNMRSFVVYPILDLSCATEIKKSFQIPEIFNSKAIPIG